MSPFANSRAAPRGSDPIALAAAPGTCARGDFPSAVVAIIALSTALLCWLIVREGFVVTPRAIVVAIAPTGLMGGLFALYRHWRDEPVFAHIFWALGLMTFVSYVDAWLAIVGLAAGFPLQDARLMGWSRAVGVDYRVILGFVAQYEVFGAILGKAYLLSVPLMFVAPVILATTGQFARLKTFVRLYVILLTACVVISIVVPAKGFALFEPLPTDVMARLPSGASVFHAKAWEGYRTGALRTIDPTLLQSVAEFPSFHTIMALLAIFAFWRTRALWLLSLAVNIVVLLSLIPIGGHYIWDIVAAAFLFAAVVALDRPDLDRVRTSRGQTRPLSKPAAAPAELRLDSRVAASGERHPIGRSPDIAR
jgi:hypothetical protein